MAEADIPARDSSGKPQNSGNSQTRGTYRVIRVDGTETVHQGKPTLRAIERLIGCSGLDTVTIDRRKQTVMFVDDTDMIDGKPVNPNATELYHATCKPGFLYSIHGDVVIVPAEGLA